jgi:hypothetical protein
MIFLRHIVQSLLILIVCNMSFCLLGYDLAALRSMHCPLLDRLQIDLGEWIRFISDKRITPILRMQSFDCIRR